MKIGSLFAGYGGLSITVEHVFDAELGGSCAGARGRKRRAVRRWGIFVRTLLKLNRESGGHMKPRYDGGSEYLAGPLPNLPK